MSYKISNLPDYIGLAWRDKNCHYYRNETLTEHVKYTFEGEPCMSIDITSRGTLLTEYYQNMKIGCTTGVNLEQAVFHHFARYDLLKSPIYAGWKRRITDLGNIHVNIISKNNMRFLHFPSIYLLSLQIPIVSENKESILLFQKTLERLSIRSSMHWVKRVVFYPTKILEEEIQILNITLPIAISFIVSKLATSASAIGKNKLDRAILSPTCSLTNNEVKYFTGESEDGWLAYSMNYRN